MIAQDNRERELRRLIKRREELRFKLRDHFSCPASQRDYKAFELVVDEMDDLRKRIQMLKEA